MINCQWSYMSPQVSAFENFKHARCSMSAVCTWAVCWKVPVPNEVYIRSKGNLAHTLHLPPWSYFFLPPPTPISCSETDLVLPEMLVLPGMCGTTASIAAGKVMRSFLLDLSFLTWVEKAVCALPRATLPTPKSRLCLLLYSSPSNFSLTLLIYLS